jgi:hypothetical protein
MESIVTAVQAMGTGQVLLASAFLGCYSIALGKFAGPRSRLIAIGTAILAAVGFVALGDPWEASVILLALAPLGMGLFAAAAWALSKATEGGARPTGVVVASPPAPGARTPAASASMLARLRARLRVI